MRNEELRIRNEELESMKKAKFKMTGNASEIEKSSESSCLCASVLKKDAGAVECGFDTETQRRRGTEFKMTEIGLIPEDWEVKRLGELFVFKNGYNTDARNYGRGIPVASVLEALSDRPLTAKQIRGKVDASGKDQDLFSLKRGDLIFTRSSEVLEDVGRSNVYEDDACAMFGGFVIRGRPRTKHDSEFINYLLKDSSHRNRIIAKGAGAQHYNIGQNGLAKVLVSLPPLHEQKKIAETLSDVDELLAAMTTLIEKKRAIKQGAMQELLTGKKRLPGFGGKCRQESLETEDFNAEAQRRRGSECKMTEVGLIPMDWEVKRLGEICDILDNRRIPLNDSQRKSGPYPYCGANGVVAYIDRYIYDEDVILIAEDGGNFEDFATKQIAYQMSGKFWVNNHAHVLVAKEGFSQSYIFFQLEHKDITDVISGGTRAKLTRGQLEGLIIVLPPFLAEQKAIAEVLSDMDAEISELEAQKAKFESIKQGMMQELLTGKTRLKGV